MSASQVTDEEFVELWNKFKSPTAMARYLGVGVRTIHARRTRIEGKTGKPLVAVAFQGTPKHEFEGARLVIAARRDVNRFEIDNGVIIVGSDAHYSPGHTPTAHKALCNLVADLGTKVKAVILNGDILDGGQISRHPRVRWKKAPTVKQELEAVQERLGDIERAVRPGTHLLRTYGNHCARFETRLAAQVPEYEGIGGFLLRDHLPKWTDSERIDINEDCVVIHDWHAGIHSGWNDVLRGGCTTVTGHTHELSVKAHRGFKKLHYGVKTGMLADEWQDEFGYRQSKPGFNWQSGFAVLTWVDGEMLYPEFCAVRDSGKAYFRGRLYAD